MPPIRNTIRSWALVAVAVSSFFLMGMLVWLTMILSGSDWCARALNAERLTGATDVKVDAMTACIDLLTLQVGALAFNSHVMTGSIALCLAVLVVIVLAGGKVSFQASKDGVSGNIGSDAGEAAQFVASEAQGAADKVAETAVPAPPAKPAVDDPDKENE